MPDNLVSFKGVSKTFSDGNYTVQALKDISFSMKPGEILGVIGESGSGKSTLAKVLTGLHRVSSGQILYRGEDIVHYKRAQWHQLYTKVQMVFQSAVGSFNPRRKIGPSIEETICLLCLERGNKAKDMVGELLKQVGLKESYRDKYPHELSGGECQRAAIARAMAVHPELLICDEATSALDVSAQAQIIELLLSLRERQNMAILFINHDLPLVSNFTENLIIMHAGEIVERGTTKNILENPQSRYTQALIDAIL